MIDVTWLKTLIEEEAQFAGKTFIKKATGITLTDELDLPRIYVGYSSIHSRSELFNKIGPNLITLSDEDTLQVFETNIVCMTADFSSIWNKLKNKIVSRYPDVLEENFSGLFHIEGGIRGEEQRKLWHLDNWGIYFPTITN